MNIALIGYGKMGRIIEQKAKDRNHIVCVRVDPFAKDADIQPKSENELINAVIQNAPDIIIEFSHPDAVKNTIKSLAPLKIPLVVGTTGWYDELEHVRTLVKECNTSLFYATNYSIGVAMFYKIVQSASALMNAYDEYDVALFEEHHAQKADSPSGTALDLARLILAENTKKTEIITESFHEKPQAHQLHVASLRLGSISGTHSVLFDSVADTIELTHRARNREGFALGAVRAAEWLFSGLSEKTLESGALYTMDDMLS